MPVHLKPWQQVVVNLISEHADIVGTEEFQSMAEFSRNSLSRISLDLPRASGHTALTAWLSSQMKAMVIATGIEHWENICKEMTKFGLDVNRETSKISWYELDSAILRLRPDSNADITLESFKAKLMGKQVVVVDNASSVPGHVLDYIFRVTKPEDTAIVLLH